jgi:hypothetical protein
MSYMLSHPQPGFAFPHNYKVQLLESAPPAHPAERLHHYPAEIAEGDRAGIYLRVIPREAKPWRGFFALGFDSDRVVHMAGSCPDPESLCVVSGGYAYVVKAADPSQWFRIEQRPVTDLRALPDSGLLLFCGFTSITALDRDGIRWTTARLSWEGLSNIEVQGDKLLGQGWDAMADQEVPFEVDLLTGKHTGGARPGALDTPKA